MDSMETRLCPYCSSRHPMTSRVCPSTGLELNWTMPICPSCGSELRPGAHFCYACGALTSAEPVKPAPRAARPVDAMPAAGRAEDAPPGGTAEAPAPGRPPSIETNPALGQAHAPALSARLATQPGPASAQSSRGRRALLILGSVLTAAAALAAVWLVGNRPSATADPAVGSPLPVSAVNATNTATPTHVASTATPVVKPSATPTSASQPAAAFTTTPTPTEPTPEYSLAFVSNHEPDTAIYLMDPDRPAEVFRVPYPEDYEIVTHPAFCGDRVAFEAADRSLSLPIWVFLYDLATGEISPIEIDGETPERMRQPRCSPDGRLLAATTFRAGRRSLTFIDLASGAVYAQIPAGIYANLGFVSWPLDQDLSIWMGVRASGYFDVNETSGGLSDPPGITRMLAQGKYPAVSPDGNRLAFFCGNLLYLCMADFPSLELRFQIPISYFKRIDQKEVPANAAWTASGEWLYFSSSILGNWDVYRMQADGSRVQNLTETWSSDEYLPAAR